MSVITASQPQPSSQGQTTLQSVAAILSASLLGLGLAYFACSLLIPAIGREGSGASFLSGVICSSGNSSASPQTIRWDE
jgi:hypothetical protein